MTTTTHHPPARRRPAGASCSTPRSGCRPTSCARCSSNVCSGRCGTPTTTCRSTGSASTPHGVHPDDCHDLSDLAKFPTTTKADLRDNYPFGMFAVPQDQVRRIHASSGTTGRPTVVGYTARDIDTWADRDGPLDPGGRRAARAQGAQRLRLRPVHRRPRRALRHREAGRHGHPDLRRDDPAPGPADQRLPAGDHHGHAVVHAHRDRRVREAGPGPGRDPRCRSASSEPSRGPSRCGWRSRTGWTCTPWTSTGCPR